METLPGNNPPSIPMLSNATKARNKMIYGINEEDLINVSTLGKATKTGKAVNIGRKLLAKGGEKEEKKKDDRRRYSEPSSAIIPRGSAAKNTSVLAPVPKLAEVNEDTAKGDDDILVIKDTVISIHKILKTTFKMNQFY